MTFESLVAAADSACLKAFPFGVIFNPAAGGGPISLVGITRNPAMEEDYTPGSLSGVTTLRLFVRLLNANGTPAIVPLPIKGDHFTVNSVVYDLWDIQADREGGGVLSLRRNA